MFKIAVCDDEGCFRTQIREILENYAVRQGVQYEIDTFSSGQEFVGLGIKMVDYKIAFLDINMDGLDGLMTAKKIREVSKNMFIIFITVHMHYTFEGYQVDVMRYILKNNHNLREYVHESMDAINEKMNYNALWKGFYFKQGYQKVSLERLFYIESKLHMLEFHIIEDKLIKYTLCETLNKVEEELAGNGFVRIHQSFLVNMRYIKSISKYSVLLYNGCRLNVPRARYGQVEEMLIAYQSKV